MATTAKAATQAAAKQTGAGIRLAPVTAEGVGGVAFGTPVIAVHEAYCAKVVHGSVAYGAWNRSGFNAKQLHGTLQLEWKPDGYEPAVQIAVATQPFGHPLNAGGAEFANFDVVEIDTFDAFVSLMVSLRDALFASGMVDHKPLVPLDSD